MHNAFRDDHAPVTVQALAADRLTAQGVRRVTLGDIVLDGAFAVDSTDVPRGSAAYTHTVERFGNGLPRVF